MAENEHRLMDLIMHDYARGLTSCVKVKVIEGGTEREEEVEFETEAIAARGEHFVIGTKDGRKIIVIGNSAWMER